MIHLSIDGEVTKSGFTKSGSLIVEMHDCTTDHDYVDANNAALMNAIIDESVHGLKEIARCAIDTMPDVSCAAIASALGLKLHSVVAMSNGRHNKAKRRGVSKGIELAEVTREELIENYRRECGIY